MVAEVRETDMSKQKAPPVLRDGVSYASWKHELSAWVLLTDLTAEKQALSVYVNGLEGKYKDLVSKIEVKDLNHKDGMKKIIARLDEFCEGQKAQRAYSAYEKLYNYRTALH